jgi:hypothetical protein
MIIVIIMHCQGSYTDLPANPICRQSAYTGFHQMFLFWSLIIQWMARNADIGISRHPLDNQAPEISYANHHNLLLCLFSTACAVL